MPSGRPRVKRPVDESMSLLNQLLNNPLDAGYEQAARADPSRRPRRTVAGSVMIVILAAVLGVVTMWGVRALRLPDAADTRQSLERQAEERSKDVEQRRDTVESLQSQLSQLRTEQLPASVGDPGVDLKAGTTPESGPGLVVTLDDAPAIKKDPIAADPDQRVRDTDIQLVVNGLWAAGAEAIAVNGHRLTSLSAIRTAGSAIQVDLTSLRPPYAVAAIGQPDALQVGLTKTRAHERLALLQSTYGIVVQFHTDKNLSLPAATVTRLRYATSEPR